MVFQKRFSGAVLLARNIGRLRSPSLSGKRPAGRLLVATDVRLTRLENGRFGSAHPSVSDQTLARYLNVGREFHLIARLVEPLPSAALQELADTRISVSPLTGDTKSSHVVVRATRLARQISVVRIRPADVVVVRLPEFIGSMFWLRAKVAGARVVSNLVAEPTAVSARLGRPARFHRAWLTSVVKLMVKRSNAVIYVTRELLQHSFPAAPGIPTLGASNVSLPPEAVSSAPRVYTHRDPHEARRLVAVGDQNSMLKGHDLLIRCVARLRSSGHNVLLDLVGGGTAASELISLARELGVADHVVFHGFVSERSRLTSILDSADFFVMPSRTEGLPRSMVEAMARGMCCIGSRVGGIPELAPEVGLFAPDSESALYDCIARMMTDADLATAVAATEWERARDILRSADPMAFTQFLYAVAVDDSR